MKKILSFLVVLTMILSCAAIPAMASEVGVTKLEDGTVIIDDAATAFTFTGGATSGAWKRINNGSAGYATHDTADNNIHHTGKGAATSTVKVTLNAGVLTAGYYNVNWWNIPLVTGNGKAPTSVSYTIAYEGGAKTATGTFDGANGGNNWLSLEEKLYFSGNGQEYIEITAITSSTQGFGADAVKFVPVKDESEAGVTKQEDGTVIIDDAATAFTFTGGATSGAWKIINNGSAGYATHDTADNNIHHTGRGAATSTVKVTLNAGVLTAGYYNVNWWNIPLVNSNGKAPTSVSYTIAYEGGAKTATGTFDGANGVNSWLSLEEKLYFSGNGQEYIEITAITSPTQGFGADAVKFVPVADSDLGVTIRDIYATVTLEGGATQKIAATEKVVNGAKRYYIANVPANAQSYTITCTAAAASATVKINNEQGAGTLTTDSADFVAGKADVYEISITNGSDSSKVVVLVNKGAEVTLDTNSAAYTETEEDPAEKDADDKEYVWKDSGLLGYDEATKTKYHAAKGANCQWTPAADTLSAGTYKLQFYNIYNTSANVADGATDVDFEIASSASGALVKKTINVNLRALAEKAGQSEWITIGEFSFSGNGDEYVKVIRNDESSNDYLLRVNAIRFSDPDIIVDEYGIIENGGNFTGVFKGYNLNVKTGVEAKIILAKFNKTTKQLEEVKYEDTATEIKNYIDLSNQGAFTIATPIITAAESDDVMFKVFVWTKGTLVPLYEAKTLSK